MQKRLRSPGETAGDRDGEQTVAVVVTTYNHAHFLGDALASIAAQTRPADEIIVVDDGSTDDPAAVAGQFPGVELIRFDNGGLSIARNRGAGHARSRYVLFLDADDVLRPAALEAGLACMKRNEGAGFVYGAYRLNDATLSDPAEPSLVRVGPRAYLDLLANNVVVMHGAVLYDRARLLDSGGFDPELGGCEDYDVYMRLARDNRVASHAGVVADYRMHAGNMSHSAVEQLEWARRAHAKHRPNRSDHEAFAAWQSGQRLWPRGFATRAWRSGGWGQRRRMLGIAPGAMIVSGVRHYLLKLMPESLKARLRRRRGRGWSPKVGAIDFGDFLNLAPISRGFGSHRGTPVDRVYIERFLAANSRDIRGRVLEVGDDAYSRRFGGGIERQDVLNVKPDAPGTTIAGDLGEAGVLPSAAFDCIVLTQTLHLIYDMAAAVRQLHDALAPGGVILATVPGISPIDPGEWGDSWYWSLTGTAARRLFAEAFGEVEVGVHGNALVATSFIQGVAAEELGEHWFDRDEPTHPVVITIRARKAL